MFFVTMVGPPTCRARSAAGLDSFFRGLTVNEDEQLRDATTTLIVVEPDGEIRYIYDDALREIMRLGDAVITRASHVEPTEQGEWTADMRPSDGPVLGPFVTREEALQAERRWLEANGFGR